MRTRGLGRWAVLALLAPFLTTGCVSLGLWSAEKKNCPPKGAVCQVATYWTNQVAYVADPVHGGAQTPGIAGRMWLFGEQWGKPVEGDGCLVVDLYDMTCPEGGSGEGKMLEEWRIDKETLKRLGKPDMVGWGYTLFLPWATYRPDVTQIRMKLAYVPAKGAPVYSESTVTLNRAEAGESVVKVKEKGEAAVQPAGMREEAPRPFGGR